MIDKRQTCQGCPDRALGCRTTCAGWAYREAQKPERYARNVTHAANYNTYSPRKESIMKRAGVLIEGKGR